ncbi:MAG: agmatine deiminase [Eubacterium sp.]|nr:agmatine deiminase [Eubacterium sp.]
MKTINSTAAADGFRLPAEFEPHSGCVLIFPERADSWQYGAIKARKAFAAVATEIAKCEKVTVLASAAQYQNARLIMPPEVRVVEMSSDDAWARDVSPEFVVNDSGDMRGVSFGFNAWGGLHDGLYFPWDKDDAISKKLCDLYDIDMYDNGDFILEGGSISCNGEGTLLTTEACLLSGGRNPNLTKAQIEARLHDALGIDKVIWLKNGILGDETNEHVDNICVFCAEDEVLLSWDENESTEQHKVCAECLEILENSTTADGRPIKVHKIPMPSPVYMTEEECEGLDLFDGEPTRTTSEPLSASYVNLFIANDRVVMPFFGGENEAADKRAQELLQKIFPTRKVVGIYARDILIGGGNIHCITHQIPEHK